MAKFFLRKKVGDRIVSGHPWVFHNELGDTEGIAHKGDIVELYSYNGSFIGKGFYNPDSQIRIRILSYNKEELINEGFFKKLIVKANTYRKQLGYTNSYRVVYGETDGLPGLNIDKYDDYLVLQTLSYGIDKWKETIVSILQEIFNPRGIYERNDVGVRTFEGLPQQTGFISAEFDTNIIINEQSLKIKIDLAKGQRTGHYLDHSANRLLLKGIIDNTSRVLDVFCGTGMFSLYAAQYGAASTTGVDNSEKDIHLAKENAKLNNYENKCVFTQANGFDFLKSQTKGQQRYNVIILDPPPFAKNRQSINKALSGYKEINLRAMQLLENEGYLVTCCNSSLINDDQFKEVLLSAASDTGKTIKQAYKGTQSADHPVIWNIPTTEYMKFYILQII